MISGRSYAVPWIPAGFRVLVGDPRPGTASNLLLVDQTESPPRLLKIYRRRRGVLREGLEGLSARCLEGRRGVHARSRWETEARALSLWRREGCDAPALLRDAPPAWAGDLPTLWLEYTPGPLLWQKLHEEPGPYAAKAALVAALARAQHRRQARALELEEPLLLHEHATIKHVLVHEARLVTIDHEGGYAPGYPLLRALGRELLGVLRSLWLGGDPLDSPALRDYLDAYPDRALMRQACEAQPRGGWGERADRRRRGARAKSELLAALRRHLD